MVPGLLKLWRWLLRPKPDPNVERERAFEILVERLGEPEKVVQLRPDREDR